MQDSEVAPTSGVDTLVAGAGPGRPPGPRRRAAHQLHAACVVVLLVLVVVLPGCQPTPPTQSAPTPVMAAERPTPSPALAGEGEPASALASPTPEINRPPQPSTLTSAPPSEVTITIFHETHTHGQLVRRDGVTFAHYAGLVGTLRAQLQHPEHSLFLGDGDDLDPFLGGYSGVFTEGKHVVDAFNAAGLDADTFGFNELDLSVERLRDLVARSRFAWVSANVRDGANPQEALAHEAGARRWVIREVGAVRVGLTGVVSQDPARPGGSGVAPNLAPRVQLLDPAEALREVVPLMRAEGAQVVVVLAHLFRGEQTERLAREVPGIDVTVGAHVGHEITQPRVVDGTIVSVACPDMECLGQLTLSLREGRVARHAFQRHAVSATSPVEPAVQAVLDGYLGRD